MKKMDWNASDDVILSAHSKPLDYIIATGAISCDKIVCENIIYTNVVRKSLSPALMIPSHSPAVQKWMIRKFRFELACVYIYIPQV